MMKDRVCVVTGATSGIGRAAAFELARRGARVAVHGRSREKCERAVAEIKSASGNDRIDAFVADLGSQEQVRALAAALLGRYPKIHVLLNNAGLFNASFSETVDGIETTVAVNHLASFLLTNLLLDRLRESQPARIVNISSEAHRFGELDLDDLEFRRRKYRALRVYGVSKLLNVLFTNDLAGRLEGAGVTANALHPGVVNTGLGDNNPPSVLSRAMRLTKFLMRAPEKGAETSIFLASSPDVEGETGKYWVDCREKRARDISYNRELQRRLWEVSESMTGLAFRA
jgi:NAD(P)-dependent dehydrogenase (short-subunit alcohol dehydrogenase family)